MAFAFVLHMKREPEHTTEHVTGYHNMHDTAQPSTIRRFGSVAPCPAGPHARHLAGQH